MEQQLLATTLLNINREISRNENLPPIPLDLQWKTLTGTSAETTFNGAGIPRTEYYVKIDFTPGKTENTGRAEYIYQLKKDAGKPDDFLLKGAVQVDARFLN